MQTSLIGRKVNFSRFPNKEKSIEGRIVGIYLSDKKRTFTFFSSDAFDMEARTICIIELLDFDKGSILEIPIEQVRLEII